MKNILDEIWLQRNNFYRVQGLTPNTVNMHPYDYNELERLNTVSPSFTIKENDEPNPVFGMKVLRSLDVIKGDFIVSFTIEN